MTDVVAVPELAPPRVRVTLSWIDSGELVVEELRAREEPYRFGRKLHDRVSDSTVSRGHFEIQSSDGLRWCLTAYATENGLKLQRDGEQETREVLTKAMLDGGDRLHAGRTVFTFRIDGLVPDRSHRRTEPMNPVFPVRERLTRAQSVVVEELAEPAYQGTGAWKSNGDIAKALVLEVVTVRKHLQDAYSRLHGAGLENFAPDVAAACKRSLLVEMALASGYGTGSAKA